MRGLPAKYIREAKKLHPKASRSTIFKEAWKLYKKGKKGKVYKGVKTKSTSGKVGKMPRRRGRKKRHYSRKFAIPVAPVLGFVKAVVFPFGSNIQKITAGNYDDAFNDTIKGLTGYDVTTGKFDISYMSEGLLPIIVGMAVHKLGNWIGINRLLARYKIPIRL